VGMRFSRNTLAALLTIVALGALAAVALASGGHGTTTAPRPTAETDPPAHVVSEDGPNHDIGDDHGGGDNRGPGSSSSGHGGGHGRD